ncbi:MAG: M16 family metallopeptidase [Beijerinckiaceae bacterium]
MSAFVALALMHWLNHIAAMKTHCLSRFIRLLFLGVVALISVLQSPSLAQEKLVSDRVFLVPDPKSNAIQFQMVVLAGSADETNVFQFGMAHYLEHLVLVGRNAGNTDAAVRFFADGSSNGWTSARATAYIHRFPANAKDVPERLDRLFKFYTERLTDFTITPEDAFRERNVVRQEHDQRYAGDPYAATAIEMTRYLYPDSPVGRPTIGTTETIAAFTVEEAKRFHQRWYRKNNVYFIVTGPLQDALVKDTAEKYLKALDAAAPPRRDWVEKAYSVKADSRVFRKSDKRIANPSVSLSQLVSFAETDPLKTIATRFMLTSFLSSKLAGSPHSVLVEGDNPVASAISFATVERQLGGVLSLSIGSTPELGRTVEEQLPALKAYMVQLAAKGIDEATLERLKKRFDRDYKRQLEEPQAASGRLIAWLTSPLPYERLKELPDAVAKVTTADISAMLRAVTGNGREAIAINEPQTN